ncbi:hypothetical protein [Paenibacillus phytohabitans]|uniref:hypothetical protein n=1 Tax=Paenibacillus phytohabitans TaxID=2654978 RepID=UPI0030097AB6
MDILGETFKNTMGAMSMAMIETLGLYLALPLIGAGLLLRYVFRINGQAFKVTYGIIAIVCMYFFVYKGIPHYQAVYESKLAQ